MTVEELGQVLPGAAKRHIAEYGVNVYTMRRHQDRPRDRSGRPHQHGAAGCLLQAGQHHSHRRRRQVYEGRAIETSYGAKGQNVVDMNKAAVDARSDRLWSSWTSPLTGPPPRTAPSPSAGKSDRADVQSYLDTVMLPAAAMEGDVLTTSQVMPGVDGTLPAGHRRL